MILFQFEILINQDWTSREDPVFFIVGGKLRFPKLISSILNKLRIFQILDVRIFDSLG